MQSANTNKTLKGPGVGCTVRLACLVLTAPCESGTNTPAPAKHKVRHTQRDLPCWKSSHRRRRSAPEHGVLLLSARQPASRVACSASSPLERPMTFKPEARHSHRPTSGGRHHSAHARRCTKAAAHDIDAPAYSGAVKLYASQTRSATGAPSSAASLVPAFHCLMSKSTSCWVCMAPAHNTTRSAGP